MCEKEWKEVMVEFFKTQNYNGTEVAFESIKIVDVKELVKFLGENYFVHEIVK